MSGRGGTRAARRARRRASTRATDAQAWMELWCTRNVRSMLRLNQPECLLSKLNRPLSIKRKSGFFEDFWSRYDKPITSGAA